MTVSYPVQSNIEFYRGDGGGTNQVINFTHPFMAADVTNAKFYLRDEVDGTLRLQLTKQANASQWDLTVDQVGTVTPNPDDTAGISEGEYRYDIKVITATKEEVAAHGVFFLKGSISEDVAGEDPVPENTYYVSSDQKDALDNANSPTGANPIATMNDVSGADAVLKTTDPTVNDDANDGYLVGTRWINTTDDKAFVCLDNTVGAAVWTETTAGGSGESNTGSNQGVDGVGVFRQKTGVDLEFRHVAPGSSKITVTLNGQDIDIDLAEANVNHDNLSGFVADEHSPSASAAEVTTGTATNRHITPNALRDSAYGKRTISVLVNGGSVISTGDGQAYYGRIPSYLNGWNIIEVAANRVVGTGLLTIMIHNLTQSQDILTTALTIDANEKDSKDAAAAAVIDTAQDDVTTGDRFRVDIDGDAGSDSTWVEVQMTLQKPS